MTKDSSPLFKHLVVDAGPLINNTVAPHLAEVFYTIPEVVGEIKDAATRDRLSRTFHELKLKNPSPQAMKQVREFARATGDLASLSLTDLKVAALTLTLELEANGEKSKAKTVPGQAKVHERAPKAGAALKGESNADKSLVEDVEGTITDATAVDSGRAPSLSPTSASTLPPALSSASSTTPSSLEEGEGEWITADNIQEFKAKAMGAIIPHKNASTKNAGEECILVGCISTDFAVQNLLLQMRLKVYGPEGYRIRRVKNWLLRCHACYWTTKQMERRFCDKCGNPTLLRTSYMVDDSGNLHLFLRSDFQYNNRGTKATLPAPQPGRKGNQILLREDQKEYERAVKKYEWQLRKANASFGSLHTIDDRLAAVFGGMSVAGRQSMLTFDVTPPVIGFGRRNPNQARRKV